MDRSATRTLQTLYHYFADNYVPVSEKQGNDTHLTHVHQPQELKLATHTAIYLLILNFHNKHFELSKPEVLSRFQNSISTTRTEWLVFREANAVNSMKQIKAINIWWPT